MHRNVTISPDSPWLEHWKWLGFIPLNLVTTLPILGFFVGRQFNDPFGSGIGVILGLVVGFPLQLIKGFCRGDDQGVDLDYMRNKRQLQAGIGVSVVGAVVAWFLANDQLVQQNGPVWIMWFGVFLGCVAGFAAGVMLTGACLAIMNSVAIVSNWFSELRQ